MKIELPAYHRAILFAEPDNYIPLHKCPADAREMLLRREIITEHAGYVGQYFLTEKALGYRRSLIDLYELPNLLPLAPNPLMTAPLIVEADGHAPAMRDESGKWETSGYDMSGSLHEGHVRLSWKFPDVWTSVSSDQRREGEELWFEQDKRLTRFMVLLAKHGWTVELHHMRQLGGAFLIATPPAEKES